MVGKTLKKTIAKSVATVMTAMLCAGSLSGMNFAAERLDNPVDMYFDYDTNILSMIMDAADDIAESPYDQLVVSNYNPYLAVRKSADINSEIVGKLFPASYGEIVEKGDEWTKITSGDVTGYVQNENIVFDDDAEKLAKEIGKKVVKINVEELNIRSGPNFISEVIASGEMDETFQIVPDGSEIDEATGKLRKIEDESEAQSDVPATSETSENENETKDDAGKDDVEALTLDEIITPVVDAEGNDWYRVHLDDSYYGYVFGDCVDIEYQLEDAVSLEEEKAKEAQAQTNASQTDQTQAGNQTKAPEETDTTTNTGNTNTETTKPENSDTDQSDAQTNQTTPPATNAPDTTPPTTSAPDTTAPETTPPETEAPPAASTDDAYLLACLVYCEAGAQTYDAQLGVANVVLNRVNSPYFENSISGVIYEANQFGPAYNGSLDRALANGPSSTSIQAANDALAGSNNIGNYLFFNNYAPSNASSVYTIGLHVFYTYSWL